MMAVRGAGGDLDRDAFEQPAAGAALERDVIERDLLLGRRSRKWAPTFWCSSGRRSRNSKIPRAERLACRIAFRSRSHSAIG